MNNEIPAEAVEEMKRESWPSVEEQKAYWEERDAWLDRTEATCDWFDSRGDGHGESNAERNL